MGIGPTGISSWLPGFSSVTLGSLPDPHLLGSVHGLIMEGS